MQPEDFEALEERIEEVYNEVQRSRQAIEWLEDHCPDNHLSANLQMVRSNLFHTEEKLSVMAGYPPSNSKTGIDPLC